MVSRRSSPPPSATGRQPNRRSHSRSAGPSSSSGASRSTLLSSRSPSPGRRAAVASSRSVRPARAPSASKARRSSPRNGAGPRSCSPEWRSSRQRSKRSWPSRRSSWSSSTGRRTSSALRRQGTRCRGRRWPARRRRAQSWRREQLEPKLPLRPALATSPPRSPRSRSCRRRSSASVRPSTPSSRRSWKKPRGRPGASSGSWRTRGSAVRTSSGR
mmetsp:Transcript_75311/g.238021  ORF Transcript_75311/g.238021 Transcript_75311/m.238021 type:complete len:215 (+) Transcript_75311:146-790(+)